MPDQDDEDAGRRRSGGYRTRRPRSARDTGRLAARLAPLEERMPAVAGRNGAGPDDTIRLDLADLSTPGGPLDEEEDGHGVFYMPPVVTVSVGLFLAYTIFVAVLIVLT